MNPDTKTEFTKDEQAIFDLLDFMLDAEVGDIIRIEFKDEDPMVFKRLE